MEVWNATHSWKWNLTLNEREVDALIELIEDAEWQKRHELSPLNSVLGKLSDVRMRVIAREIAEIPVDPERA